MPVPVAMFPEVRHTSFLDKRLFNQESQRYVCVLQDNNNNSPGLLATKTLSTHADVDVDFRIHYFSSAVGKMAMLVHRATGTCLSTNEDNRLELLSLHEGSPDSKPLREADPQEIKRADSRLFYVRSSGVGRDSYVIKSISGGAGNLYLTIGDNGASVTLKPHEDTTYPPEMVFIFRKCSQPLTAN